MKNYRLGLTLTLILCAFSANVEAAQCRSAALKLAKAIRTVEMRRTAQAASFRIVSQEISEESETYIIEMLVQGSKTMTDQRLVMVGGVACVLAIYDMPGAG